VASGDRVLVACADGRARRGHLAGRLGGFDLCSWAALERDPRLAGGYAHVVALDPPLAAGRVAAAGAGGALVHLAWGEAETAFAMRVLERTCELRPPVTALYRALRDGEPLPGALAATGPPAVAGRALRVLVELGLVELDRAAGAVRIPPVGGRTALERSAAFRAAAARLEAVRPARAPEPVQPSLPQAA
jgi:single-stranded-DNA-specific exonuclease